MKYTDITSQAENKTAPQERGAVKQAKNHGVKTMEVIEVTTVAGDGTYANPNRFIREYWSKDGELLAVSDPEN